MRIQELDLQRYGKFTDQRMSFPVAARDFHFVVGANEAGKSTTRSAILDLLFGIETRSNFDFLHAKADMRLGAKLVHGAASLQFERSKARSKSLFDGRGQALPEAALAPFLGAAERGFFEQMFGLDHGRLEAGGKAILSASNDLGQILFQSAAGIGSLAAVREQLETEADKLWAKRRSGERAYYAASDELAAADVALKAATVRTKDWLDARNKVHELEQAKAGLRAQLQGLELQRAALERARRVAPSLRQIRSAQQGLGELQQVRLMPVDAARSLSELELELASAGHSHEIFVGQAQALGQRLAALRVDETLLRQKDAILALEQGRQQVRGHDREIERCRVELSGHWQQIEAELRRLGWPELDQAALAQRLPPLPVRSGFAALAKRAGLLEQACRNALGAEAEKAAELQALLLQSQGEVMPSLPAGLTVALEQARGLGDVRAVLARCEQRRQRAERELQHARAACGVWDKAPAALRALNLPSEAAMQQRVQRQFDAHNKLQSQGERQAELRAAATALALEISQYTQAHQPVGWAELAQARELRNAQWQRIKSGETTATAAAVGFELSVQQADGLADQRHAKAREASELQAKQDALARLGLQIEELDAGLHRQQAEAAALAAEWQTTSAALGLGGMAALDLEGWRQARQRVLEAQDLLDEALQEQQAVGRAASDARAQLAAGLSAAGLAFEHSDTLETLLQLAQAALAAATAAAVRAEALARQVEQGRASAGLALEKRLLAQADAAQWQSAWAEALQAMQLPEGLPADAAEAVCAAMADIDACLKRMRDLRLGRIEVMQRELSDFAQAWRACAAALQCEAEGEGYGPADAGVQRLMSSLGEASAAQQEAQRLRAELAELQDQAAAAELRLSEAAARLQPLLQQAGVAEPQALRECIAASDRRRLAEDALRAAEAAVAEGGDGLALTALEAELAALDVAQIPLALADLAAQIAELQHQSEVLTADLSQANAALGQIAGQDDAARAEGQRQDALAKMANAAERYVKVYTAAKLLKWAIDRYRETKQGPMLGRAGEIFSALTLGSFQRLSVDFEAQPLTLHGLRADGRLVEVAGMSEGTRDQLFMALRLAALELHIGQDPVHALPFVADDLFINYDDGRAEAGLRALAELSARTQVIFLSHHAHLLPAVRAVFGDHVNVIRL